METGYTSEAQEYYHYSFPELCQLLGKEAAQSKVRRYLSLSKQYVGCEGFVVHNCRLLTTFLNPEITVLERKCSVFYAPIRNTTRQKQLTIQQVAELIKSEKLKPQTEQLRTIEKNEFRKSDCPNRQFKNTQFPYATFSGTFTARADINLIKHTGLICVDLDHIGDKLEDIRAKVIADPETVMCFISPNGDGLKVLYEVDSEKFSQEVWYMAYSNHLGKVSGVDLGKVDKSCKDISRACFLPYDPEIFINPCYKKL